MLEIVSANSLSCMSDCTYLYVDSPQDLKQHKQQWTPNKEQIKILFFLNLELSFFIIIKKRPCYKAHLHVTSKGLIYNATGQ